MSTANFRTQKDFDLYCYDGSATEEQIKDYREYNLEKCQNTEGSRCYVSDENIYEWLTDDNYSLTVEDFKYNLREVLKELGKDLNFYTIELKDGYYYGLQFYVKLADKDIYGMYGNNLQSIINDIDNEDTRYYYDMCKSEFKRKITQEVKFINKKVMPLLARYAGFEHCNCIGVLSNGEAIYEKVA